MRIINYNIQKQKIMKKILCCLLLILGLHSTVLAADEPAVYSFKIDGNYEAGAKYTLKLTNVYDLTGIKVDLAIILMKYIQLQ